MKSKLKLNELKFEPGAKKSFYIMGGLIAACVAFAVVTISVMGDGTNGKTKSELPVIGGEEKKDISGNESLDKKIAQSDADAAKKASSDGVSYIPLSSGKEEVVTPGSKPTLPSERVKEDPLAGFPATTGSTLLPSSALATNQPNQGYNTPSTDGTTSTDGTNGTGTNRFGGSGYGGSSSSGVSFVNGIQVNGNTATINGQQVQLPTDPNQRSKVLDQLYEQEVAKKNADSDARRMTLKMARINQIAEYMTTKEGYSETKPSESWLAVSSKDSNVNSLVQKVDLSLATKPTEKTTMIIKSGERAYVNIETATNTDEPSTVIAQLLSGKALGMTLFGEVTQNKNYTISIKFNKINLPNGTSADINAMAVDPQTGRTSIKGDVDSKIFERFVLPMVAGGLGAYGDIMSKQGTVTTMNPLTGTPSTTTAAMTGSQIKNASIGTGVKSVTALITSESAAAKPATSTNKNLGIEIIFLKEVIVKETDMQKSKNGGY